MKNPTLKITVQPSLEPVSLVEIKQHCALDASVSDFNSQLQSYITAARQRVEDDVERGFVQQTWTAKLDWLPDHCIELRRCPVSSVSSITYVDNDGATQTWGSSNYLVDTQSEPARITPAYGISWPSYREQMHAITVTFVVGYGATAASVPEKAKQPIRFLVEQYWNNRSTMNEYELNAYKNLTRGLRYTGGYL